MTEKILANLTNDELLKKAKKSKTTKLYDAVILGILVGIAVYSSVKNGFGLLTFIPLVYVPVAARNTKKNKSLENLLSERNLKT